MKSDSNDSTGVVESELRALEEEFAPGRIAAFGNAATQDSVMKELRNIAALEKQVFDLTNEMIQHTVSDDRFMQNAIFSSTYDSGSSGATSSGNGAPTASSTGQSPLPQQQSAVQQHQSSTDRAFDETAKRFRAMEGHLKGIGDVMRHMEKRVVAVNNAVGVIGTSKA